MLWNAKKMLCLFLSPPHDGRAKQIGGFFLMKLVSPCEKFCSCPFSKSKEVHTCWIYIFFIMPLRRCKSIFFFNSWRQSVLRGDVCLSSLKWSLSWIPGGLSKTTNRCRATESGLWKPSRLSRHHIYWNHPSLLAEQEVGAVDYVSLHLQVWHCCRIKGVFVLLSPRGRLGPSHSAPAAAPTNRSKSFRLKPATPVRPQNQTTAEPN